MVVSGDTHGEVRLAVSPSSGVQTSAFDDYIRKTGEKRLIAVQGPINSFKDFP